MRNCLLQDLCLRFGCRIKALACAARPEKQQPAFFGQEFIKMVCISLHGIRDFRILAVIRRKSPISHGSHIKAISPPTLADLFRASLSCTSHKVNDNPASNRSLQTQADKVSSDGYEINSYPYVKDSLLHGRHLCYNADNRYGHMKECEL